MKTALSIRFYDGRVEGHLYMDLVGARDNHVTFAHYHAIYLSTVGTVLSDRSRKPTNRVVLWPDFYGDTARGYANSVSSQMDTLWHELVHVHMRLGDTALVDRFKIPSGLGISDSASPVNFNDPTGEFLGLGKLFKLLGKVFGVIKPSVYIYGVSVAYGGNRLFQVAVGQEFVDRVRRLRASNDDCGALARFAEFAARDTRNVNDFVSRFGLLIRTSNVTRAAGVASVATKII